MSLTGAGDKGAGFVNAKALPSKVAQPFTTCEGAPFIATNALKIDLWTGVKHSFTKIPESLVFLEADITLRLQSRLQNSTKMHLRSGVWSIVFFYHFYAYC